jgi:hypothetical protein
MTVYYMRDKDGRPMVEWADCANSTAPSWLVLAMMALAVASVAVAVITTRPETADVAPQSTRVGWSCPDFPVCYEWAGCEYRACLDTVWDCPVKLSGAAEYCPPLLDLGLAGVCREFVR